MKISLTRLSELIYGPKGKKHGFIGILCMLLVAGLNACAGSTSNSEDDREPPVSSASPGASAYASMQSVALICDDGAGSGCNAIYYTIDGSEPTDSSTKYTMPIEITANASLKYFSVDGNGNKEAVHIAQYIIDTEMPVVTASHASGTFNNATSVELTCDDGSGSGCDAIFYTIDGSNPSSASTEYSGPVKVSRDLTLKFIAFDDVDNQSVMTTETYKIEPIVGAHYPNNGALWNDYVNDDGESPLNATDTTCSSENCIHGGELRHFIVPDGSCNNLVAKDNLEIFRWTCVKTESAAYYVSTGFNNDKYLSDLLDWNTSPPVWKSLTVEVSNESGRIFSTKTQAWWLNSIEMVNAPITLNQQSTVYALISHLTSNISSASDKVTLVMAPGISLTADLAASPAPFSFENNYLWIEGQFNAAELFQENAIVNTGHHNVYSHVQVVNTTQNAISLNLKGGGNIEGHNRLLNVVVANSATGSGSYYAISISTSNNSLQNINSGNNYEGILLNPEASDNILNGVTISNTAIGLWLNKANNNIISNVTSTNSINQAIALDQANNNLLINTFVANSNSNGVQLGGDGNTVSNLISTNNNAGIYIGAEGNQFSGLIKFGSNNDDCVTLELANPGLTSDCENQGSFDVNLKFDVTSASTFVGKIAENDTKNSSDTEGGEDFVLINDWTSFDNRYRAWGRDGNAYPDPTNQYFCIVGDHCRIWDWSLAENDTGDNGGAVALNVLALPTGDDVLSHVWFGLDEAACKSRSGGLWDSESLICSSKFLRNAVERMNDFDGNENGLCESNETCIYTPNIGAYQGHGDEENIGTFVNGIISGVKLK